MPLDDAQAYFLALRNARYRRWVDVGEGTHLVLLERQRMQVIRALSGSLTEAGPTST